VLDYGYSSQLAASCSQWTRPAGMAMLWFGSDLSSSLVECLKHPISG